MNKRFLQAILGGSIILGVILMAVLIYLEWNQPMAEGLGLPTGEVNIPGQLTSSTPNPVMDLSAKMDVTPIIPETSTPIPTATPEPYCGGPARMMLLALGIDSRTDNYRFGLADVIKIVRIDFIAPKVTVVSIPRDLWVEIPGLAAYGITHGKLNQAYAYGTEGFGYYTGPGGAPGLMARALQKNFDLSVDHYVTVNMRTFERIVDAVGGVDVYLPEDVDGRPIDEITDDMGYFYAGVNHFDGNAALRFSRIRKTDTIFNRIDRQTIVLCALKDKLLQPKVISDIPELIASFQDSLVTDLSPKQMSQLACLLPKLSDDAIIFGGIPKDELRQSIQWDAHLGYNTYIWEMDFDSLRDYVYRFEQGSWPQHSEDSTNCPPPVNIE